MKESTPTKPRNIGRDTIRSHLVLEVASELVDRPDWPYRQARINLREQGGETWPVCLFGSDAPAAIDQVARGELQVAIINPAGPLALALRGKGPFKSPIPLRAITVIPSPDQLAFAVTERTGLKSLHDIRDRRFPLRISIRGQMDHSLHLVVKEVLSAAGFSLDDVVSWGGQVRYDPGLPNSPTRLGAVQRGEADMIIDEAVRSWVNPAIESDMRILPFDEPLLEQLEELGFPPGGDFEGALRQIERRRAHSRFQRLSCVHARERAGYHRYFDLFRPRGKKGKNPVARRRSPTLGPHVS